MISWQRVIYLVGRVLVEATPAAFLLTLVGSDVWALLIVITFSGTLADWLIQRRVPAERQRPVLVAAGLLIALWAVKGQIGGGFGLLDNWGVFVASLSSTEQNRFATLFFMLPAALYVFWRGAQLRDHDSVSLYRLFIRTCVGLLILAAIGAWAISSDPDRLALATSEILTFFAASLLALALAHVDEVQDSHLRRIDWRGLLALGGAVALVLVPGVLFTALLGPGMGQVLRSIWQGIVLIILLILAPIFLILGAALTWLLDLIHLEDIVRRLREFLAVQPPQQLQDGEAWSGLPLWLRITALLLLGLLPILLIVALVLLVQRRTRRARNENEERESLLSWQTVAGDLRDLFGRLHTPFRQAGGLHAALARMRGNDPVSRVRRSYIRLLLAGEQRDCPREPAQTPHEYAPAAVAMLPQAAAAVEALTAVYERARYHPAAVLPADADAAEQAWATIDKTVHQP